VIKGWYNRKMNKNIRGNMTNIMELCGTLGLVIFVVATGKAFDSFGPSSPFTILAGCDMFVCVLTTVMACMGWLKA
jgi:hypothetical protein